MTMLNLKAFRIGWRRRSAMILDYAGAPVWLVRLRCRPPRNWGTLLYQLAALVEDPTLKYRNRKETNQ